MRRRAFLATVAAIAAPQVHARVDYAQVVPRPLVFPRDHGAHPDFRTEWWYLTGWLDTAKGPLGFQVTFFRVRTAIDPANPSAFAAQQLIVAHAAIADPARGALLHDERIARAGFGVVGAAEHDTDVRLDRWTFARRADGSYRCELPARLFTLEFDARPTQPLLLQGDAGFSRKGPESAQASYYYSQPQLAVRARVTRDGRAEEVTGTGWLDHEWSSTLLAADAVGWDWMGINLDDGAALTAFQLRRQDASALWTYASLRPRGGAPQTFGGTAVAFEPLQSWTSPRTRASWPVAQRVRVGDRTFATQPLFIDQELDSRASTGAVYWEGASRLLENDRPVGRGYLEMTGYVSPIRI